MKKVLSILVSVLLVALLIFCIHSCSQKNTENPPVSENTPGVITPEQADVQQAFDDPSTEFNEGTEAPEIDENMVFEAVGIYHGRVDTNSVEITLSTEYIPRSYRLSPDLAKSFSSMEIEENTIISFKYRVIDGQSTIISIEK